MVILSHFFRAVLWVDVLMEALVLLMKKKTVLPAPANRHGVEKSANGVNLNGSETDGVSDLKKGVKQIIYC